MIKINRLGLSLQKYKNTICCLDSLSTAHVGGLMVRQAYLQSDQSVSLSAAGGETAGYWGGDNVGWKTIKK